MSESYIEIIDGRQGSRYLRQVLEEIGHTWRTGLVR